MLLARIVLAFKVVEVEREDDNARKAKVNIVHFSDEHKSLVAMPGKFDCCFEAREVEWLRTKLES